MQYDDRMSKARITISLDQELVDAAARAVEDGRAESVSAWVNAALAERSAKERRLALMREMIEEYEAEHGEITREEVAAQLRADRDAAAEVRARVRARRGAV